MNKRARLASCPRNALGLALLVAASTAAIAQDIRWTPNSGGNWNTVSNWFNSDPPTNATGSRDVYIHFAPYTIAGFGGWGTTANTAYTINRLFSGADFSITSTLTINGASQVGQVGTPATFTLAGTLTGPGNFTVHGPSILNSGTISGAGALTFNGMLNMATGSGKTIERPFTFSHIEFSGAGFLRTTNQTFTNTGIVNFLADADWYDGTFTNAPAGIVNKTGGAGDARMQVLWTQAARTFNNQGTVGVTSGRLLIEAPGTHTGTFQTSGTGILRFPSSVTHTHNGSTLTNARVQIASGTHNFNAGTSLGGMNLELGGGTVNLNTGSSVALGSLTLSNATIDTANALGIPGPWTMTSGTIQGAGNVSITGGGLTMNAGTITGGGTLSVAGPITLATTSSKRINRPFSWTGAITFTGSGYLQTDGITLANTGIVDFQADADWYDGNFTNAPTGTIRKTGGSGEARLQPQFNQTIRTFNNNGTVSAQSGDLAIHAGGTHTGTFQTTGTSRIRFPASVTHEFNAANLAGARIGVTTGTMNFNAGTTLTNLDLAMSGGSVNLATGSAVTLNALTFTNGTISTSNTLNIPAPMTLSGGTLTGTGDINFTGGGITINSTDITGSGNLSVAGPITLATSSSKAITRPFTRNGALTFTGTGYLRVTGVNLTNTQLIDFQADADWYDGNLTNGPAGIIRKSGGAGESGLLWQFNQASRTFNNNGQVQVQSGNLSIQAGGTHTGTFSTTGTSRLRFTGSGQTHTFNGATLANARVDLASATLNLNAGTNLSGLNLNQTSGTSNFATGSAVTLASLTFTNGTINTANQLNIPGPFTMSSGTFDGAGNIAITGGGLTMNSGEILGSGTLSVAGPITMATGSSKYLDRTFTKDGDMTFTGSGWLRTQNASHTNNHTIDFQTDAIWYDGNLTNAANGTIRKSGGTGDSALLNQWLQVNRTFNNAGTVTASTGRLAIDAGGTHTGVFSTTGTGILRFAASGQTHNFNANATMANARVQHSAGTLNFNANSILDGAQYTLSGSTAALNLSTGNPVTLGSLAMSGGTLTTANALNIPGPFTMSGGEIKGAGAVNVTGGGMTMSGGDFTGGGPLDVAGDIELTGSGSKQISRTLTRTGALRIIGTGWLQTRDVTIENAGLIDFQNNTFWYDGNVVNQPAGTIRKSAGTGNAALQNQWQQTTRTLRNLGTIEVLSGRLNLDATLENYTLADRTLTDGTFRVDAGCTLKATHQDVQRNLARVELNGVGAAYLDSASLDAFRNLNENLGGFAIRNGRDFARTGVFTNSGDVVVGSGGSDFASTGNYVQTDGLTQVDGQLAAPAVFVSGGQVSGTGSITAPVTMTGGTFAPGAPSTAPRGTLNVAGNYAQNASTTFSVLMSGNTPANYSNLVCSGTVTLAGTLSVEVTRGFAANAGDTIRVIQGLSRVGTFAVVPDPADWQVIYGPDFVDLRALRPIGPPALIRGNVTLDGWIASPSAAPITIELRQGGVPVDARIVTLDGAGDYEFITRLRGTYDVTAKGSKWLRGKIAGQVLGDDGLSDMDYTLIGGDVSDDNRVDLDDFLIMAATYEVPVGDPIYDGRADLNGDEAVNLDDFLILAANYELVGEE